METRGLESFRPLLARSTMPGLPARTVRIPIFAQQKWLSCAPAGMVDLATADSKSLVSVPARGLISIPERNRIPFYAATAKEYTVFSVIGP